MPRAQRNQIEAQYEGGIAQFVYDCVEAVFARLPLADNYFWRVYMTGHYTPDCCPEYLKPENFQKLRDGLADRIEVHTDYDPGLSGEERSGDLAICPAWTTWIGSPGSTCRGWRRNGNGSSAALRRALG